MKTKFILSLCIVLSLTACNKEPVEQSFSPAGYWQGKIDIYAVGILVRENGSSRLYMGIILGDTSRGALEISEGQHVATGNSFRGKYAYAGDTLLFVTDQANSTTMKGSAYSYSGGAFGFEIKKW